MQRPYSPWLGRGLSLAVAGTSALGLASAATAMALFDSRPLDGSRFAVLAKPVGSNDWTLLVLEQIQPQPLCWQTRPDGLIDPALNRFDFTGICSRYLDSNGYSLRIGADDMASRYRLRLEQRGTSLALLAMNPNEPSQLLVGRGTVPQRDRDGFVQIQLAPGWQLERRLYRQQTLSHVYFANATPLAQLLNSATEAPTATGPLPKPAKQLPPLASTGNPLARSSTGPIALQVVPFRP